MIVIHCLLWSAGWPRHSFHRRWLQTEKASPQLQGAHQCWENSHQTGKNGMCVWGSKQKQQHPHPPPPHTHTKQQQHLSLSLCRLWRYIEKYLEWNNLVILVKTKYCTSVYVMSVPDQFLSVNCAEWTVLVFIFGWWDGGRRFKNVNSYLHNTYTLLQISKKKIYFNFVKKIFLLTICIS